MLVWKSLYLGSLRDNWNIASDFHIKFIGLFLKNFVIEMSIGAKFLKTSFLAGVLFSSVIPFLYILHLSTKE